MKNLTLNFYSEKQQIPLAKELSSQKKAISENYNLSLSDVDEIEINYNKNTICETICNTAKTVLNQDMKRFKNK